ncbi:hypothetical protein BSKO_01085 [Bryopsis sp. KO-2023]|nr:hypothetical protein BSKO_01085 [Bryopsis sp. KO-2023]
MWLATSLPSVGGTLLRTLCLCLTLHVSTDARSLRILPDMVVVTTNEPGSSSLIDPTEETPTVRFRSSSFERMGVEPASFSARVPLGAPRGDPTLVSSDRSVEEGAWYEWITLDDLSADQSRWRRELASSWWTLFRFPDLRSGKWRLGEVNPTSSVLDGGVGQFWFSKEPPDSKKTPQHTRRLTQNDVVPPPPNITSNAGSGYLPLAQNDVGPPPPNSTSNADSGFLPGTEEEPSGAMSNRRSRREEYIMISVAVVGSLTVILFLAITVVLRLGEQKSMLVSGKAKTRDRDIQCAA